jgi:hypothetical protein
VSPCTAEKTAARYPEHYHSTRLAYFTTPRSVTSLQTLQGLHGATPTELDAPKFYLPENITVATDYEIQQLQSITPTDVQQLHDIHTRMSTVQQTFDMDSLLHVHHTSLIQEKRTYWFATTLPYVCALVLAVCSRDIGQLKTLSSQILQRNLTLCVHSS